MRLDALKTRKKSNFFLCKCTDKFIYRISTISVRIGYPSLFRFPSFGIVYNKTAFPEKAQKRVAKESVVQ